MTCNCAALAEMRAALASRNNLARERADLADQVADLTAQVERLKPLAQAGRELVAVEQSDPDEDGRRFAWRALVDAAEAWWDQ